jgi:hypothetical protein
MVEFLLRYIIDPLLAQLGNVNSDGPTGTLIGIRILAVQVYFIDNQ